MVIVRLPGAMGLFLPHRTVANLEAKIKRCMSKAFQKIARKLGRTFNAMPSLAVLVPFRARITDDL